MPPYNFIFLQSLIGHQKCNNYLVSNCPSYTGVLPATSLGQVSKGWRKGMSEMPWGFDNRNKEEPLIDIFRQHLFTHHISWNTVTWNTSQCMVSQNFLHLSVERQKEYKILIDNPYDICSLHLKSSSGFIIYINDMRYRLAIDTYQRIYHFITKINIAHYGTK